MSLDFFNDIENGEIDEILAKAQEESLRYYNEVELPRLQKENNGNKSNNISLSQCDGKTGSILYDGADATGFHLDAGKTYIYPTNYPVRQYQASMVKTALFKNTLVSLPTGLGKTFIAAVVMYNYYRWYPNGKVVFMAPTRPLVAQQTKACHHIMNIPVEHTAELTGMQNAEQREKLWKEKRVFYLTPQVMVNDLKSKTCPASLIRCIVIDEAHRATKDYAYCQVLKLLSGESDTLFRVLGLSATPGSDINAVQQVVRNLGISVLEMRSEDSLDVAPYTHSRSVNKVVVELSDNILRVKEDLLQVFEKYAKQLKDYKALPNNIATVSKFQILKASEKFRANPPRGVPASVFGNLISNFSVCMSLAHSLELLQIYGLRAFYTYLSDENSEKTKAAATRLRNDEHLTEMLKRLQGCLFPKLPKEGSYTWSHPKLKNLVTALTEHFQQFQSNGGSTKAIIFCQYRVVVSEIVEVLSKFKPLIKATEFIGQSGGKEKGMPQAKQLQIMKDFRNGVINCLVATCVAEEGLDIGEVDLIILMEAHKSPVRLVQRIGRTGRKRKGNCLVLLTKGREEQKFQEAMATRKSYVENIMKSPLVKASLCQDSPRMIPIELSPVQQLVHINVTEFVSPARPQIKKQSDIRKCFATADSPFLPDGELLKVVEELGQPSMIFDQLPKQEEIWYRRFDKRIGIDELLSKSNSKLAEWNEWNHEEQEAYYIDHTSDSKLLCHILKLASKEVDLPDLEGALKSDATAASLLHNNDYVENNSEAENSGPPNKRKKMKKGPVKKNLGLDIRNCMAMAVEKSLVPVQKQIIEVLSDEDDQSGVDVIRKTSSATCDILQLNIAKCQQDFLTDLFIDGNKPFANLDKFIPSINNTSKKWTVTRNLPDLETFFEGITIEVITNLKLSDALLNEVVESKITQNIEEVFPTSSFFEIDDLLHTESDDDCLNTAISAFHKNIQCSSQSVDYHDHIKVEENVNSCITSGSGLENSKIICTLNQISTTSNVKNDIESRIELQTIETQQLSCDRNIDSSNNAVTNLKPKVTTISQTSYQGENDLISNNCKFPNDNSKGHNIISSTPNPSVKNFKKNQIILKNASQVSDFNNKILEKRASFSSDSSEMWNLSDLFEEDEIKNCLHNRNRPFDNECARTPDTTNKEKSFSHDEQNTTMLGITQMVSLIEMEKCQCKTNDCEILKNNNIKAENDVSIVKHEVFKNNNYAENDVSLVEHDIFKNNNNNVENDVTLVEHEVFKNSNNGENDVSLEEQLPLQSDNNLSDYLDCDVEIFTQLNDEPVVLKHSPIIEKTKECLNEIYTSECNKSSHINEIKTSLETKVSDNIDNLINNNDNSSTQDSQSRKIVNFKKFTAKKVFSRDKNSQSNFSQNNLNVKKTLVDKNSEENYFSFSGNSTILNKASDKDPIKRQIGSETLKLLSKSKTIENRGTVKAFNGPNIIKNQVCEIKKIQENPTLIEAKSKDSKMSERNTKAADENNSKPCHTFGKNLALNIDSDDSDIFEEMPSMKKIPFMKKCNSKEKKGGFQKLQKPATKHKEPNNFIEKEAEVSGIAESSDDTDGSSLDDLDDSFINDDSEYISNNTQAIYLKSVKSPLNKGKFKIPVAKPYFGNVYSQQVEGDSEYINDSFCVDSEVEEDEFTSSLSLLEIAERKLENKNNVHQKTKRRRILTSHDVSSPDKSQMPVEALSQPSPEQFLKNRKRRIIQSDSENEMSPVRKNHFTSVRNEKVIDSDEFFNHKQRNKIRRENVNQHNIINLSSDEDSSSFEHVEENVIDLTLDGDDNESDSDFERKFQQDLKEAIIRSQSDARSLSSEQMPSQTSTPKTDRRILDVKRFDKSVHKLNQKFSQRLDKIRNKFCSSDESFGD